MLPSASLISRCGHFPIDVWCMYISSARTARRPAHIRGYGILFEQLFRAAAPDLSVFVASVPGAESKERETYG